MGRGFFYLLYFTNVQTNYELQEEDTVGEGGLTSSSYSFHIRTTFKVNYFVCQNQS